MKQFHRDTRGLAKLEAMAENAGFELWKQLFEDMRDWRNPDIPRLWPWIVVAPPPARPAVLERNPYYWKVDPDGNQLPYIDRMTFEIFDAETINLKAINGEMGMQGRHLQFQNYPLFMEGQKKGDYRIVHWINGSAGANILALNLNHRDPVLKKVIEDHRFRKALSHALNREELNEADYFGIGKPRQVCPPPSSPFYDAEYERAYIEYDPDRANDLLDQMGLTRREDGLRLRPDGAPIKLYIETTSLNNRILELVASYWTAVGCRQKSRRKRGSCFTSAKRDCCTMWACGAVQTSKSRFWTRAGSFHLAMNPSTRWITRGGIAREKNAAKNPRRICGGALNCFGKLKRPSTKPNRFG